MSAFFSRALRFKFESAVFEALDAPGEWYLDRPTGRLYYLPMPDEDLASASIIAPRLETLVSVVGTPDSPVHDIHFENIAFAHTQWDYAPDFAGSMQAADLVPGAIQFRHADRCVLYGCAIAQIAQYGVEFTHDCHQNAVVACVIRDVGAGGVKVGHEEHPGPPNCAAPIASSRRALPMATTISDNIIHDAGVLFPSAVGVWVGNAGHNHILHNHIFDLHYTGISVGWIWGHASSRARLNLVENNHVHHIAWDRMLHDLGAIYTLGVQPGTTIRQNHVHHVGGNGIYLDEGSSQILVEGNLAHHLDCLGMTLHYGRDNLVRRNILALGRIAHMLPSSIERHRSVVHTQNVIYWKHGRFVTNPWGSSDNWLPAYSNFSHNLLWDARGQNDLDFGRGMRLEDWEARDQHTGTRIADPLFGDPDSGDFSLRPGSPVADMGIRPLNPSSVGPRLGAGRPADYKAWSQIHGRRPASPIVATRLVQTGPSQLRIHVDNLGDAPANAVLKLRVTPQEAATLAGTQRIVIKSLRPGDSLVRDIPVRVRPNAPRRVIIETHPQGDAVIPAAVHFFLPVADWLLAALPVDSTEPTINKALESQTPRQAMTHQNQVAALLRGVVVARDLVLGFEVTDHDVKQGQLAWQGSCIEVFATPPDSEQWHPSLGNPDIRQVYLVPGTRGLPPRAAKQDGVELPAPEIDIECRTTRHGYQGRARIPLSLLGVKSANPVRFLFQAVVTSTVSPKGRPNRASLFYGGISASGSNLAYGLIETVQTP